jgi:hypothetical protein
MMGLVSEIRIICNHLLKQGSLTFLGIKVDRFARNDGCATASWISVF